MSKQPVVCPICPKDHGTVIKHGFFKRATGHKSKIQRFLCKLCRSTFSAQTDTLTYRERKPHLTQSVMRCMMESVSQRGCARLLRCHPTTVARKIMRLGKRAGFHLQNRTPFDIAKGAETTLIFDEMETFEHSKCKAVSIALAVAASTREVVAVAVAEMPPKSCLAEIARKRYGHRRDNRSNAIKSILAEGLRLCPNTSKIKSDMCSRYRTSVIQTFGKSVVHEAYKGRRGCVVGQGELKRGGKDPLFALNHTCAMFRDRIKRLARRTWCTTKKIGRLYHVLCLYAWWHNQLLKSARRPIHMD